MAAEQLIPVKQQKPPILVTTVETKELSFLRTFLRGGSLFLLAAALAQFTAPSFGWGYNHLFPYDSGLSIFSVPQNAVYYLSGLPLAYEFFVVFLFTSLNDVKKQRYRYWWIVILLVPAALVEIYFDLSHIYLPIIITILGWLLGLLVSFGWDKLTRHN